MRRAVPLFALLLAAFGAWLWFQRSSDPIAFVSQSPAEESARANRASPSSVADAGEERSAARAAPEPVDPVAPQSTAPAPSAETTPSELVFFGRIVRNEDGAPEPSAQVVVEQTEPSPTHPDEVALRPAVAADGIFEARATSHGSWIARATADGFAAASFPVLPGHSSPDAAFVVRLERPARLAVRVVDVDGQPLPGHRVSVEIRGLSAAHTEIWYDAVRVPDILQECTTDPDGAALFDALPPRTGMRVEVSRGGEVLLRRELDDVVLPGETHELELVIGARATLGGIALDQEQRPVPDLVLWILKDPGYGFSSFESTYLEPDDRTRTDADGHFRFEGLADGWWYLGPAPAPENAANVAPCPQRVQKSAGEGEREIVLHVSRDLFVHGRVVLASGGPAADANVLGRRNDTYSLFQTRSRADGTFALGPLPAGEYDVTAGGMNHEAYAPSSAQRVAAGARDVLLVVEPAATIFGRIEDEHGEPQDAELMLSTLEPSPTREFPYGFGTTDGGFGVHGLAAGRYDLVAKLRGPRIAFARFTLATGERRDLVLRAEPAATLVVRNTAPSNDGFFWFELRIDGVLIHASGLEAGRFERCVVPTGNITVEFLDPMRKPLETRTVGLASGEEKNVERPEAGD